MSEWTSVRIRGKHLGPTGARTQRSGDQAQLRKMAEAAASYVRRMRAGAYCVCYRHKRDTHSGMQRRGSTRHRRPGTSHRPTVRGTQPARHHQAGVGRE
ncbi:hypothetical protein O3G_MSEX015490 [Manduca sexta]|uniref:Uncharacterized protein n=1 Tax=Manduca sexta TaxID=7130 RepID=A0A921ZZV0_MANSE|nr:hypothetical protein O3G_MSEX015490 [Manduca sexta]